MRDSNVNRRNFVYTPGCRLKDVRFVEVQDQHPAIEVRYWNAGQRNLKYIRVDGYHT
jgi:hypothetical protein